MKGSVKEIINNYNLEELEDKYYITKEEKRNWGENQRIINREIEMNNKLNFLGVFDYLKDRLDRLPKLEEYLDKSVDIALESFKRDFKLYDESEEALAKKIITFRVARTYVSRIQEEFVKEFLAYNNYEVYEDELLDTVAGIDIVVKDIDKFKYIHLTTTYDLNKKENCKWFKVEGKWFNYNRDFRQDIILNMRDDKLEWFYRNGWKLPKLSTLKKLLEESPGEDLNDNKLIDIVYEFKLAKLATRSSKNIEENILSIK